jgi:predicted dehydrogenase
MATNSVKDYAVVKEGLRVEHSLPWLGGSVRDAWREQLADFVAAIREEGAPRVSGEEGTRVIRLVEACYKAKHERQLPLTAPQPGFTW